MRQWLDPPWGRHFYQCIVSVPRSRNPRKAGNHRADRKLSLYYMIVHPFLLTNEREDRNHLALRVLQFMKLIVTSYLKLILNYWYTSSELYFIRTAYDVSSHVLGAKLRKFRHSTPNLATATVYKYFPFT